MNSRYVKQFEMNNEWLRANGIVDMPLKAKYATRPISKKGAPKGNGNSGGVGRAGRRKKHGVVVSSYNSPLQYGQWERVCKS